MWATILYLCAGIFEMRLMVWRFTQTAVATLLSECLILGRRSAGIGTTMPFNANVARPNVNIDSDLIQRKHDRRFFRRRSSSHDIIRTSKHLNPESAVLKPRNSHHSDITRTLRTLGVNSFHHSKEDKENQVLSIPRGIPSTLSNVTQRKVTISVEGNIGCGKTTLLNYLAKRDDVQVNTEPVSDWKNCRGHNLLGLMYEDPVKWTFTFQSYVQLTMLNQHILPHTRPIKLLERSLQSARYCFVENMAVNKRIADAEYTVLDEWFQWLVKNANVQLDQIVYLRSTPEICHQRIRQRCRKEELGIPLEYLQEIHDRYEEWLIKKTKFTVPAPVIILDAQLPLPEMIKVFEQQQNEILLKGN
ncbi:Thymidine kinase 2, mitochondrial [Holothuria leucospilota]|uniref:Thymidine kinase 2, mitochondrial n=1 Tax=Holothuria leucospilota TaxID=206669 RepID=A0A9Q1CB90_HOLLE|nr:Thymidine kinase 2, mitochondrial [Holothuria leucospilota]